MEKCGSWLLQNCDKSFSRTNLQKASVKPSLSYLATNLPGLAVTSCCKTAAILWEVSKSHSEGNQNIIVCWLSWIQLSISTRGRWSHKSHAHGKPSQQLHHVLSSEAKQYEREIAMAFAHTRCLLAANSAVRRTVRRCRQHTYVFLLHDIIANNCVGERVPATLKPRGNISGPGVSHFIRKSINCPVCTACWTQQTTHWKC